MAERTPEDGFSLLEVLVCSALLAAASVAALGVLPALVRRAEAGVVRSAALATARNALVRARAAAAYLPAAAAGDAAGRRAASADRSWAFVATASFASAVQLRRAPCGNATVPLDVVVSYDASSDRLSVRVAYPRDPCDPASPRDEAALATGFAPALDAPCTLTALAAPDPALQ